MRGIIGASTTLYNLVKSLVCIKPHQLMLVFVFDYAAEGCDRISIPRSFLHSSKAGSGVASVVGLWVCPESKNKSRLVFLQPCPRRQEPHRLVPGPTVGVIQVQGHSVLRG